MGGYIYVFHYRGLMTGQIFSDYDGYDGFGAFLSFF
jgi:hypothetical protein